MTAAPARWPADGALPQERSRHAPSISWLELSELSSPGGAGEAAAPVLAIQAFVANGGRRPPARHRRSAASPGRTGSGGRVGRRGVVAFQSRSDRRAAQLRCIAWGSRSQPENAHGCSDSSVATQRSQTAGLPCGRSSPVARLGTVGFPTEQERSPARVS